MVGVRPGRAVRVLVATAIVAGGIAVAAAPAGAHAALEATSPASRQVLEESPRSIELQFNEPVDASDDAIRVFDAAGDEISTQRAARPEADVVQVRLTATLPAGGYVATWRVSSLDAHPIQGAFTFTVREDGNTRRLDELARALLRGRSSSPALGVLYGVARWMLFASLALLIGGAFALAWVVPSCRRSWRANLVPWLGLAGVAIASVGGVLTYGPYRAGGDVGDVLRRAPLEATLDQRYGHASIARLAMVAVGVGLLASLARMPPGRRLPTWWVLSSVLAAVALAATPAVAGHPSSGDLTVLAIPADTLHVLAMAVWLGALTVLVVVRLRPPVVEPTDFRAGLAVFSPVAFTCVVLVVATGVFQAWRQVRAFDLVFTTEYGRLLVLKVALVGLVLAAASAVRRRHHREARAFSTDGAAQDTRVVRWLAIETGLLVAVLAVTALLVNAPPARSANGVDAGRPIALSMQTRRLWIDVTVDPGRVGNNQMHFFALTPGGTLTDIDDMQATLDLPDRRIGPLRLELRRLTAAHYTVDAVIPTPGRWRLTVQTRVSETDVITVTGRMDIP